MKSEVKCSGCSRVICHGEPIYHGVSREGWVDLYSPFCEACADSGEFYTAMRRAIGQAYESHWPERADSGIEAALLNLYKRLSPFEQERVRKLIGGTPDERQ